MKKIILFLCLALISSAAMAAEIKTEISVQETSDTKNKSEEIVRETSLTATETKDAVANETTVTETVTEESMETKTTTENGKTETETVTATETETEETVATTTPKKPVSCSDSVVTINEVNAPIYRATFTSAINDKEPADELKDASSENENIFLFTEIRDFNCGVIKHTWLKDDKEIYSRSFSINSDRYRLWTSVKTAHYEKGETITVIVSDGNLDKEIKRYSITVK